jgi:mRNA-degrading endonuclease RelE of RelBE toxin-antitoxin system
MGREVPETASQHIRELNVQGYRIIYQIEVERVVILTVVHGRRLMSEAEIPRPGKR